MDGKVDWMAAGWAVEGSDGPFLGQDLHEVVTCEVTASVAEARRALAGAGEDSASAADADEDDGGVVVLAGGLVVGHVDGAGLSNAPADRPVLEVMHPVPSTVRPSVTVGSVASGGGGRLLVTSSDGQLLGRAVVGPPGDAGVAGGDASEELHKVLAAVEARFGDREPSEEELRGLLRELLEGEGQSSEEAERFLETMGDDG